MPIRNQPEAEVEFLDNGSLPNRLTNPEEYEPPFSTSQEQTIPEGVNETQKRLIYPVYTYGSIN